MFDPVLTRFISVDPKPNPSISSYAAFANNPIWFTDIEADTPSVSTRIYGGVKATLGVVGMFGTATAGGATSWTGVGAVAGGIGFVYSADVAATGLTQMITGEETETLTHQGIDKGLQAAGVSPGTASTAATYSETAIAIGLTGVTGSRVAFGVPATAKVTQATTVTKTVTNIVPQGNLANHLFKGVGKLADNPANRTQIQKISNGKALVVDAYGKTWYRGVDAAGKGVYSYTQNGVVKGAGYTDLSAAEMIIKYSKK